ncbi:PP2C family protein-serine/threonine phosphatase [Nocardioides piscis]|uniref:Serine/threonine protein phosphatase n=1 Tax=Nocardioides piscis TaxID=2714938 RepID=A0A6G7YIJ0_9ACTN|nr:protein phosphatase 2C domain-containing protein [Nocardioides piscis]QIK76555.1 serine/threonine protein phosphatase [Nocardioides piscis]
MSEALACPSCGVAADGESNFCEDCGTALNAEAASAPAGSPRLTVPDPEGGEPSPIDDLGSGPISRATAAQAPAPPPAPEPVPPCVSCGGVVGPDGYCEQCGVKALSARDHFREQPATWVAGVCDKGIRHSRNEDAMAMSASDDGSAPERRAVLIVLDGVSNTDDSQVGSLAGARAALAVLQARLPQGMGTPDSTHAAATQAMTAAVEAAQAEVVAAAPADAANPASATFTAAVLEDDTVTCANVGDSRIYWLPDASTGVQLSVDDSAAQDQIEAGVPRLVAESSAQAHAITKWLGRDSQGHAPRVVRLTLSEPGWLLVCSDGLWNYASEPAALAEQIRAVDSSDPAVVALALTDFANGRGGQDNITTVLARVEPLEHAPEPTPTPKEQPHG